MWLIEHVDVRRALIEAEVNAPGLHLAETGLGNGLLVLNDGRSSVAGKDDAVDDGLLGWGRASIRHSRSNDDVLSSLQIGDTNGGGPEPCASIQFGCLQAQFIRATHFLKRGSGLLVRDYQTNYTHDRGKHHDGAEDQLHVITSKPRPKRKK